MWPFSSVDKIEKSGLLNGFTDWHSHILPGVDDGVRTMDKSLAILKRYEELGVKKVWLTPHIMEDYPNTPEKLRERFEELKKNYSGNIELRLAAENMLDSLFEERLDANDFLPIGDEQRHLLVETSYMNPPYGMDELMQRAMSMGYTLVLAHPERYRYMDENDYRDLKAKGIVFQTNLVSLVGGYGETARKKAEWMLKEGMTDILGSDLHRLEFFNQSIASAPKKKAVLENLISVARSEGIA